MITISLNSKNTKLTLPINPDSLKINTATDNRSINVVGLGDIVVPGDSKLSTFSIDSFFWYEISQTPSKEKIDTLKKMQTDKFPIRFVAEGLFVDILVLIESFEYDWKAGEEEDIYYSLKFIEYKSYGAQLIEIQDIQEQNIIDPPTPNRVDNKPSQSQNYTVLEADSLWNIAKKLSNKNGNDWYELYNLNKQVIGDNPNLILPNQILQLPESWIS